LVKSTNALGRQVWTFEGKGDNAAEDKVKNLIDGLLSFEGNDFNTSADAVRLLASGSQAMVTISSGDNRDFTMLVDAIRDGGQYPCALTGGKYAYLVPQWRLEQVLVTRESLAAPAR
jgi:hypothetical protein